MIRSVVDPLTFLRAQVLDLPMRVPVDSEEHYATESIVALFSLLYDCPLFNTLKPRQRRSFVRQWISKSKIDISSTGLIGAVVKWNKLGNDFLRCFYWRNRQVTFDWSSKLDFSPISSAIKCLDGLPFDDQRYIKLVRWIYTFHVFLGKIPLTRPDLQDPSESDWIVRQFLVKDILDIPHDTVLSLRKIVTWLIGSSYASSRTTGKHGPGSTNTGQKTVPEKEQNFYPCFQSEAIFKSANIWTPYVLATSPQASILKLVPKDIKSVRPITMESISMQFAQQAIRRSLYRRIDSGLTNASRFIKFSSQDASRKLALKGSRSDSSIYKPITVDLSSASDFLSVDLVSGIFSGDLLHAIMSSRTWDVTTSIGNLDVAMFAGMGSATTFPVQSLVFIAISILSVIESVFRLEYGGYIDHETSIDDLLLNPRSSRKLVRALQNIKVYGDDIIIPALATSTLFKNLEMCGLKVNEDKSFYDESCVREACGIYAFAGEDITPARFRVPPFIKGGRADFALLDSVRNATNLAFCKGFGTLYRYFHGIYKGLQPFASQQELRRRSCRVDGSLVKFDIPRILYEEYRGDDANYIGIISLRPTSSNWVRIFGELHPSITAWSSTQESDTSILYDDYHLTQALYLARFDDVVPERHGSVVRNIRLRKRIAYHRELGDNMGWAWAPS